MRIRILRAAVVILMAGACTNPTDAGFPELELSTDQTFYGLNDVSPLALANRDPFESVRYSWCWMWIQRQTDQGWESVAGISVAVDGTSGICDLELLGPRTTAQFSVGLQSFRPWNVEEGTPLQVESGVPYRFGMRVWGMSIQETDTIFSNSFTFAE